MRWSQLVSEPSLHGGGLILTIDDTHQRPTLGVAHPILNNHEVQ